MLQGNTKEKYLIPFADELLYVVLPLKFGKSFFI